MSQGKKDDNGFYMNMAGVTIPFLEKTGKWEEGNYIKKFYYIA